MYFVLLCNIDYFFRPPKHILKSRKNYSKINTINEITSAPYQPRMTNAYKLHAKKSSTKWKRRIMKRRSFVNEDRTYRTMHERITDCLSEEEHIHEATPPNRSILRSDRVSILTAIPRVGGMCPIEFHWIDKKGRYQNNRQTKQRTRNKSNIRCQQNRIDKMLRQHSDTNEWLNERSNEWMNVWQTEYRCKWWIFCS